MTMNAPIPPEEVHVTVTDEDIIEGVPNNCVLCPIALAVERTFAAMPGIEWYLDGVANTYVGGSIGEVAVHYNFAPFTTIFIHAFDNHEPVYPFSFTMRLAGERSASVPEDAQP